MLKSLRLTTAPFVILLALMPGCSVEQTQATSPSPTPTTSLSTDPAPTPINSAAPSPSPTTNPSQDALALPDSTVDQESSVSGNVAVVDSAPQESSASIAVSPELNQTTQEVVDEFFAIGSRLEVGMNYIEYGNQVAELKVAFDKLGRQPGATNSPIYASLSSALTNYEMALTTWKSCVKKNYCEHHFITASSPIGEFLLNTYKIQTVDKEQVIPEEDGSGINWGDKIYLNTAISEIWMVAEEHVEAAQKHL